VVTEQSRRVYDGQILIEQAKGAVSASLSISVDPLSSRRRNHARGNHKRLLEVVPGKAHGDLSHWLGRAAAMIMRSDV